MQPTVTIDAININKGNDMNSIFHEPLHPRSMHVRGMTLVTVRQIFLCSKLVPTRRFVNEDMLDSEK